MPSPQRRDPGAVLHAGAAARSGRRDRATFEFIRAIKRMHPATEIMLYIYTPLPPQRMSREGPRHAHAARAARRRRAARSSFPRPRTSGRNRSGWTTGVIRTRRG